MKKRDISTYRDVDGKSYELSDVLGSGDDSFSSERQRWSTFTEVSLPLHDKWDLVFAGRLDEHDDVGATFSHQIASKYRLNKALTLRGSWSRGSRAPSLKVLHLRGFDHPYIDCDTKTFGDNPQDCARQQVERLRVVHLGQPAALFPNRPEIREHAYPCPAQARFPILGGNQKRVRVA